MLGGTGRLALALTMVALLAATAGCGDGEDSTAKDEARLSAASEPSNVFIKRLAKLLETTTKKEQCAQLEEINQRSYTRFSCPPSPELARSMGSFRVVGAEEYGTGAVVDYKSGKVKDGATIVLFVAPNRGWGIGRFGVLTKPSTKTSDKANREGYAETVDSYVAAIRDGDCKTLRRVAFNGDYKGKDLCKQILTRYQAFTDQVRRHPKAKPKYEGGNDTYGFFSVETEKPDENTTISVVKSGGKQKFVILDAAPSPTSLQQQGVQEQLEEQQRKKQQEKPDQTEAAPPPRSKS